jgi:hypothetical protein
MLYGGNNLTRRGAFSSGRPKHRPRIRLTIRRRMRVLDERPRHETIL